MAIKLTDEQKQVIDHKLGSHARVLAVAGSGKTTTMVYWAHHLITRQGVDPRSIRILMFNRLARDQFSNKLKELIPEPTRRPQVHTFHSFAYQVIRDATARKILPESMDRWLEEKEEQVRWTLLGIIEDLERREIIEPGMVDVEMAMEAISLWKGSLIPPPRAGHRTNQYLPLVYKEFEQIRKDSSAITYDDFIPYVVHMLEAEPKIKDLYIGKARVVIVDEYQDVNYGQHRLVDLLAGDHADVMVVGDDDQTIYEWRGARPEYILTRYKNEFANRPCRDYVLSHSFRFGPEIADKANRVISYNIHRATKHLKADNSHKPAFVKTIRHKSGYQIYKELAGQVVDLVKNKKVKPEEIIVLGRMFAQMHGLQAEFLAKKIPFKVLGNEPFYNRHEIKVLLGYLKVALGIKAPLNRELIEEFMKILNSPNRRITRADSERLLEKGLDQGQSIEEVLERAFKDPMIPYSSQGKIRLRELLNILLRVNQNLHLPASQLIGLVVDEVDYFNYFDDYYGEGEQAFERKQAVKSFIDFAVENDQSASDFVSWVENLDTTLGADEDQIITMTTIFRTKGLEYDYVIIPDCVDGYLPCNYDSDSAIFDTQGIIRDPEPTPHIERERRLYYVALTRARKGVYIGAPEEAPSQFLDEMNSNQRPQVVSEGSEKYGRVSQKSPWDEVK